jgi:hypothetical protein
MRSKAHIAPTVPLFLHRTMIGNLCVMKKFGIDGQLRNKVFFIVIHRFSLVKAAMNASSICKLHNGDNKLPQFINFSTAKDGTKTIAHLSITER